MLQCIFHDLILMSNVKNHLIHFTKKLCLFDEKKPRKNKLTILTEIHKNRGVNVPYYYFLYRLAQSFLIVFSNATLFFVPKTVF